MARGVVAHPWEEEVKLWLLIFIKKEAISRIQANYQFADNGELVSIWGRDDNGATITEYRANKTKKRFNSLPFEEWTLLPEALKTVHPEYSRYQEEERRIRSADKRPTTPIQEKAYKRCQDGDHDWMRGYGEFDGAAFERVAWIDGDTVFDMTRCYFCGHTEIREARGGAPYYSGPLQMTPDSIPEPNRWIVNYK